LGRPTNAFLWAKLKVSVLQNGQFRDLCFFVFAGGGKFALKRELVFFEKRFFYFFSFGHLFVLGIFFEKKNKFSFKGKKSLFFSKKKNPPKKSVPKNPKIQQKKMKKSFFKKKQVLG
jgi:hypothetical protein